MVNHRIFGTFAVVFGTLIFLILLSPSVFSQQKREEEKKVFPPHLRHWAVHWINNELSVFMEKGIVKKIIAKDDNFVVFVGRKWYELELDQKGDFLRNLSRAREITGHSPFYVVKDVKTNDTVARVSPFAIEIEMPEEGLIPYLPAEDKKPKETVY